MKPERTIEQMRAQFPTLFHNRFECLNHLFCVVGCGYCWRHGELVVDEDYNSNDKEDIDATIPDISRVEFSTKNEHNEKMKKVLGYTDDLFPQEGFRVWSVSEHCWDYINLSNPPDDITKEWRAVLNETITLLLEDGIDAINRKILPLGEKHTHPYWEQKRARFIEKKRASR